MFKAIIKTIYTKLPITLNRKIKIKRFLFEKAGFAFRHFSSYQIWIAHKQSHFTTNSYASRSLAQYEANITITEPIAIHLHLFYIDLLDEFASYLSNMPFAYDLLVSVTQAEHIEKVTQAINKFNNLKQLFVKLVPNRGRDVAPLVVTFAEDLLKYEYICHIHTKKSLYTGGEQVQWRNHLLSTLLGSAQNIKKIFSLFNYHSTLGLIYPEAIANFPYWGYTWLTNHQPGQAFLSQLGIAMPQNKYIDYSAGTMFWARSRALIPLLTAKLAFNDFPYENKQIDGTLAHVIERSLVPIVQSVGQEFAVVDLANNKFSLNAGSKNLWQYWHKTKEQLIQELAHYDVISFDIFDTLITRATFEPDSIFKVLQSKIYKQYNIADFMHKRKAAENSWRQKYNFTRDCSIHDIYQELASIANIEIAICEKLKQMEINEELAVTLPRYSIVEVLAYLKKLGKTIILISDMYLPKDIIIKLLTKNNIFNYDAVYISCNTQLRKDKGQVWQFMKAHYKQDKFIHVGDNETSDVKLADNLGIKYYHIMSSQALFELTSLNSLHQANAQREYGNDILLGLITAKIFNDPFALHKSAGRLVIHDLQDFGYLFIGPVVLSFMHWLINALQKDAINNVLFLAREGCLLSRVYQLMLAKYKQKLAQPYYFLTSRRAASVASIGTSADIDEIVKRSYEGELAGLLNNRFGLNLEPGLMPQQVNLPKDFPKIQPKVANYYEPILQQAQIEREAYLHYIRQIGLDTSQKTAVVDLGYSGSIQYYLAKMLGSNLHGYYFVLNDEYLAEKYIGNTMKACFEAGNNYLQAKDPIFKYHLILEAILTAADGQLINFKLIDGVARPIFKADNLAQFSHIEKIQAGVIEFVNLALDTFGDELLDFTYDAKFVSKLFSLCCVDSELVASSLKEMFKVEDGYTSNNNLNVFELYKQVGVL
ncbi:MAG: rhamnan synthesis F family protein [Burkholderiales bacterium]